MKAVFVVPSDYDSLVAKGVLHVVRERNEGALLTELWTIHPFASARRNVQITGEHTLLEFRQPQSSSIRFASWLRQIGHLWVVVRHLRDLIQREHVDFVRANDPYFCGLIGFASTRGTKAKFCVSLHADYDKMDRMDPGVGAPRVLGSRRVAKWIERFILSRADRVLPISRYMAGYAIRSGAPEARISVFRHNIALQQFKPPDPVNTRDYQRPVVALISRLSKQKSIDDLVLLADHLKQFGRNFQIQVAGDGPERQAIETALVDRGLTKQVALLGFCDPEQIRNLLARAAASIVFIGGAALIEAAAAESPVVAYDCEWHSEVIIDGVTGFLVPEHDTKAAAKALLYILDNPDAARSMGKNLGEKIAIEYDEAALLRSRQQIYRDLVVSAS